MEYGLEKNIKRYLKRKIKITLGFIVAFLLSCNLAMGEENNFVEISSSNKLSLNGQNISDKEKDKFNFSLVENQFINNERLYNNNNSDWFVGGLIINDKNNQNLMIINNGQIIGGRNGLANKGYIKVLINNGYISGSHAISNTYYATKIENLNNFGILNGEQYGIYVYQPIDNIENNGFINNTIFMDKKVLTLSNKGIIYDKDIISGSISGIDKLENLFINSGIILGNKKGIFGTSKDQFFELDNKGIIGNREGSLSAIEITNGELKNQGIISVNNEKAAAFSIGSWNNLGNKDTTKIYNYGVIVNPFKTGINKGPRNENSFNNYGLIVNNKGELLKHEFSKQESSSTYENKLEVLKSQKETNTECQDIGKTIINAGSDSNGLAQSIKSETIKDLKEDGEYILNGYDKTVVLNSTTGNKNINNSVINAVKNAISFKGELTLGLGNTVVNGGYGENIILGDSNKNILNISKESIVNGNISLGGGNDSLSLENTVQINGTLDGGDGNEDTLVFNSSVTKSSDKNLNILYDIKNFENTAVDTKITLFEKTIDNNGNIKNLEAQLGDITITDKGELVLRVDGTEKDNDTGKVTGHALIDNVGSITSDGGKLNLKTFGFGEEEVIAFNQTDITELKIEDIIISSALHEGEINNDNTITVSAKKDLEDLDIANYDKLNKIYHSILNSENTDKFTVEETQYGSFVKYLHDIYAGTPYAYSSELSRKTMGIMRNLADKDLKPELNKWAVCGGFTHTDGGTENSYYGKGYYTYDIGSRDISADTKISGGYFKAEYGKEKDLTTGIIFGGNNSETEIGASKVEGDSFYFGAYMKKYLNNFRFTLGAGFQHGDYKADRTAVGYDGIIDTRNYSENYHDRGFNIYGDLKYSKELGNNFFFEPSVTLEYSYVDQDGVSEDGVLAIETDSKNFDYMTGTLNLDLRKEIKSDKFTHSLTAGVSYERMLSGYDEEYITGRIKGGTDFDILVPEKEKDIFSLNAKYELETEKGFIFDVKGSYRFEHDTNKDEWIVGTGIGYKF